LFSVNYNNNDEKNSSPENKEGRKTEKIVMWELYFDKYAFREWEYIIYESFFYCTFAFPVIRYN
jgi:hypothetical protein